MALQQSKTNKGNSIQTKGPSMQPVGPDPVNPSDQIFQGRALPVIPAQDVVQRRPFSIPIRPTLHYRDGLDGAAETVTVNERRFNDDEGKEINYTDDVDDLKYPPTQAQDWDHAEFGYEAGENKNKYSAGDNEAYTKNGVWIRGT